MSYRFEREEPVGKAVRRIARKQTQGARKALDHPPDPREGVHDARTGVKKLRALLRLVQPTLGKKRYGREDRKLRKLGKKLSSLRDAQVVINTFDHLFPRIEGPMEPTLREVRRHLAQRRQTVEHSADLPAQLQRASQGFKRARSRIQRWIPPSRPDWDSLEGGLRDTYRQARQAMHAAYQPGDQGDPDAAFHDWRKAVKYHGHHMRLLAGVAPEVVQPRLEALDQLGDLLGEDHDLAVFAQTLRDESADFDRHLDRRAIEDSIARRQKSLRDKARPLGDWLFRQSPRVFSDQLEQHWRRWRAGPTDGQPPERRKTPSSAPATRAAVASRLR